MFFSDSVKRRELPASWLDSPMAVSTWDGSREPDEQAEPLDAHIPFWSNIISSVSPFIPKNDRLTLLGSLSILSPFSLLPSISLSTLSMK